MQKWTQTLLMAGGLSLLTACGAFTTLPNSQPVPDVGMTVKRLHAQSPTLDSQVATLALNAYNSAQKRGLANRSVLTIIDYSKPSTERRLWVVDLHNNKVLFEELVAHGRNSGDTYARYFSDTVNSKTSSLGLYVTAPMPYVGRHGYSLRLYGLDKGFNDTAYERALVVHGAPYVSETFAHNNGRLGLSWGCPAVSSTVVKPMINTIKGGSVIFAYYPSKAWLSHSDFLQA